MLRALIDAFNRRDVDGLRELDVPAAAVVEFGDGLITELHIRTDIDAAVAAADLSG